MKISKILANDEVRSWFYTIVLAVVVILIYFATEQIKIWFGL